MTPRHRAPLCLGPALLGGLLCLALRLASGCAKPAPWLLGRWSSGPDDDYRFERERYTFVGDSGAVRLEAQGTWSLDGSTLTLRPDAAKASSPIAEGPGIDSMTEELRQPRTIVVNRLDDNTATFTFLGGVTATFHRRPG